MGWNNITPVWMLDLSALENKLENGDISYDSALMELDEIPGLPASVYKNIRNTWEKMIP